MFPLTTLLLLTLSLTTTATSPFQKRTTLLPRQRTCSNPSWIPACPGLFACIPPGGICCSDSITYVMPPDTCPDGTSPIATAITDSPSVTPTPSPTPAPVTTPPPAPSTVIEYTYYTWYFTYTYYYYYYYIYVGAYELTSSQTTVVTSVTASATDGAEASKLSVSLEGSLSAVVGVQTATPTETGGYATETSTEVVETTSVVETSTEVVTTSATGGTTVVYPTGNATVTVAPLPSEFPGGAGKVEGGRMWGLAVGLVMVVPGVVMVWL